MTRALCSLNSCWFSLSILIQRYGSMRNCIISLGRKRAHDCDGVANIVVKHVPIDYRVGAVCSCVFHCFLFRRRLLSTQQLFARDPFCIVIGVCQPMNLNYHVQWCDANQSAKNVIIHTKHTAFSSIMCL